jgi:hypothetical protein
MRLSLLAALIAATRLAAQKPSAPQLTSGDTAAILRAAVDSGWLVTAVNRFEVVGDTARLTFTRTGVGPPRRDSIFFSFFPSNGGQVVGSTARVERHNGQWVRDSMATKP